MGDDDHLHPGDLGLHPLMMDLNHVSPCSESPVAAIRLIFNSLSLISTKWISPRAR
jgi:hypothetical protein